MDKEQLLFGSEKSMLQKRYAKAFPHSGFVHAWVLWVGLFFDMGSHYVTQGGLEFLDSRDPLTSVS
jgi:hypothetical protein